jgi:PadR family transcriptional regulator PadR
MIATPLTFPDLLETWEGTYKKGLLSFWLLLLLNERPCYAGEMGLLVRELSQNTLSADDNSIYRALNRFEELGIIRGELQPSSLGPSRRYYQLTLAGSDLLVEFTRRNILVFQSPEVAGRIGKLLDGKETTL